MFFTKSQAAFIMSAERLFEEFPKIYFWTFTFTECGCDWWYPAAWKAFSHDLQNWFGQMLMGLRVVEVHPAEYSHGLHYHALVNKRISIDILKRVAAKYGIGNCWVVEADMGTAFYLAKYLGKKGDRLSPGMRRWGTIGGFRQIKVNAIEIDSAFHRNMKKMFRGRQTEFEIVSRVMAWSKAYGDLEDWPEKTVRLVYQKQCLTGEVKPDTLLVQSEDVVADSVLRRLSVGLVNVSQESKL